MALILIYFALFLGIHFLAQRFEKPGAARLFQMTGCFILLFGFFGFRDITVLNDTPHYYGFYYQKAHILSYQEESIFVFHLLDKFEYGFQVLVHFLVKYVSRNPYTIIMLSALVFSIGNVCFLSKHTKQIALACFMMIVSGVYFDQYSMIRQAFAVMLFYRAYPLLKENRYKPYVALILIAALFHTSALILLALPLMKRLTICRRNILLLFIGTALLALSIHSIMQLMGLAGTFYYKMSMKRTAPPIAAILDGLLMVMLTAVYFYSRRKEAKEQDTSDFWICILGLCICIITPAFLPLFRLNAYIWPIVYLIFFNSVMGKRLFGLLALLLVIRISVVLTYKSEWNHIVPYSFYDFSSNYHEYHMYLDKEV